VFNFLPFLAVICSLTANKNYEFFRRIHAFLKTSFIHEFDIARAQQAAMNF
jgi:hypothetical protein